jgi:hypothetical protein
MQFSRVLADEFSLLEAVVVPVMLGLMALWIVFLGGFASWLIHLLTS